MKHTKNHRHAGVSIIEILIYVAVSSVIFVSIVAYQVNMDRLRRATMALTELSQQLELSAATVTRVIRGSQLINTPATGGTTSVLSVTPIGGGTATTVQLNNGQITISENGAAAVPLTSTGITIASLQFMNLSRAQTPGTVRIQITGSIASGVNAVSYQRSVTASASIRP